MSPFVESIAKLVLNKRRFRKQQMKAQYKTQWAEFERLGGKITHKLRIISDWDEQAGNANGHYFHQDLLVASLIHAHNPKRHIDIGSRIDGFVAHVAAFRKIEVMDVRALESTGHPNIEFLQADLMRSDSAQAAITDSISCLHAIEHFGLGRYGDPLDPMGHLKGFRNMLSMLKVDGRFYISFPIGKSNEVHFNAHRVFHPKDVLGWASEEGSIVLKRFDYVDDTGNIHFNVDLQNNMPEVVHGCGIYTFEKVR